MDKLGLIILAGGLSTRMGQPKALLSWINGESLISHALRKGLDADVQDILISIGDDEQLGLADRKSTRLNSSHSRASRMPSSA